VSIRKRTVKARPFIVGLGQSKEKLSVAGRPRVNREINYFFVKELSARTFSFGAHQSCCRLNVHLSSSAITLFENCFV